MAAEALTAEDDADAAPPELEPAAELAAADGSDADFDAAEAAGVAGVAGDAVAGEVPAGEAEQHDFPEAGLPEQQAVLGAETPAMPEPRPSFCRLVASNLPLGSRPFAD